MNQSFAQMQISFDKLMEQIEEDRARMDSHMDSLKTIVTDMRAKIVETFIKTNTELPENEKPQSIFTENKIKGSIIMVFEEDERVQIFEVKNRSVQQDQTL